MKWRHVWADRALALRLLGLLESEELAQLVQVDKTTRSCIQSVLKQYRVGTARLALSLWCMNHIELEFQSYYQELETHQIARSNVRDPRVPPRVVSIWAERGKVPGGVVTLRPEPLPKRNGRGFLVRFVAAQDQKPMLTSVVQTQRRIYTVVTLKIVSTTRDSAQSDPIVVRRLWYLKEFGEWRAMVLAAEKRLLDDHSARCRYDLVSHDGSVALELDVPRGADSMMDYYLVKRAVVCLPLDELLLPFVKLIRPVAGLPPLSAIPPRGCLIRVSFSSMSGETVKSYALPGQFVGEQQQPQPPTTPGDGARDADDNQTDPQATTSASRLRTGIEQVDIVTVQSLTDILGITTMELPTEPGFIWLSLVDNPHSTTQPRTQHPSYYYTTTMLHSGAKRSRGMLTLDAQWVPGTLESYPTLQSRQRRILKGFVTIHVDMDTHELSKMEIVAQHLPTARLEPYAATIESYTRPP